MSMIISLISHIANVRFFSNVPSVSCFSPCLERTKADMACASQVLGVCRVFAS